MTTRHPALGLALLALATSALAEPATPPRHPDAPAPEAPITLGAKEVEIVLKDGTRLVADLYLPEAPGRYPVLIEVTPYGRRTPISFAAEHAFWTGRGYAYLIVDARGAGNSEGRISFMADARRDGPQIVAWAASADFSSGKVGMRGSSYSGTYPLQTAATNPEGLACISPNANFQSGFDGPPYLGGAFMQGWAIGWTTFVERNLPRPLPQVDFDTLLKHRPLITADEAAYGAPIPLYRQMLEHPVADSFWAEAHLAPEDYRRIDVPTLTFTGWYDTTLSGTIANYRAISGLAANPRDHWLVLGPWDHAGASDGGYDRTSGQPMDAMGPIAIESNGYRPGQRMAAEFFDWCLKGESARPAWSNVQAFVPGQNRWIEADRLPLDGTRRHTFYLGGTGPANAPGSKGVLATEPGAPGVDTYVHDPLDPVRADKLVNGRRVMIYGPDDVSAQLRRGDVLTYATAALDKPMTLLGNAALQLVVESDAPDTDFIALLEDVAPDGSAIRLGSGWAGVTRARYREGLGRTEPLAAGVPTRLRINLMEHGHTLKEGHRLRLSILSSAYPFVSVNPGTGKDIAHDTDPPRPARQKVHHGQKYASALTLEVLDDAPGQGSGRLARR
jgi:putative CocE/NonD family hydrolase